jgi:hypothetical protein
MALAALITICAGLTTGAGGVGVGAGVVVGVVAESPQDQNERAQMQSRNRLLTSSLPFDEENDGLTSG